MKHGVLFSGICLFPIAMFVSGNLFAADIISDMAILRGLDKVSSRVKTIEAPVGDAVHFGTLEIIVRSCRKKPPEEPPEATAFIDIWDVRPGEPGQSLFRGWMFASSPALSALEHPVYDIWITDCADAMPTLISR